MIQNLSHNQLSLNVSQKTNWSTRDVMRTLRRARALPGTCAEYQSTPPVKNLNTSVPYTCTNGKDCLGNGKNTRKRPQVRLCSWLVFINILFRVTFDGSDLYILRLPSRLGDHLRYAGSYSAPDLKVTTALLKVLMGALIFATILWTLTGGK